MGSSGLCMLAVFHSHLFVNKWAYKRFSRDYAHGTSCIVTSQSSGLRFFQSKSIPTLYRCTSKKASKGKTSRKGETARKAGMTTKPKETTKLTTPSPPPSVRPGPPPQHQRPNYTPSDPPQTDP